MSGFGIDIDESRVCIFPDGASKHDALDALIDAVALPGGVADIELFRSAVYQREAVMSTGIGEGVAIPHVRFEGISQPAVGVGISRDGIDYGALDNAPVHIMVLFAMPAGADKEYLDLLAQVMLSLKTPGSSDALEACSTKAEVVEILRGLGS